MKRFLKVLFFLIILFSSSIFLATYVRDSDKENRYTLQLNDRNNLLISIGYYAVKPILEIYIDSRLDRYGLFDGIRSRLFYDRLINKSIIKNGEGYKIQCGDKVDISAVTNKDGETKYLEYIVGKNDIPIFNIAPIGMKKGEEALIHIPNSILKDVVPNPDDIFDFLKIEIIDIENKDTFLNEGEPIILEGRITNEKAKLCGDDALILYEEYDLKGNKLGSEEIDVKIGSKSLPFENLVIGMQPLTKKVAILNGNLIDDKSNDNLKILFIKLIK